MSGCPSSPANVYEIDPTSDGRWESFLQTHPRASIFHTRSWLEALRKTYGYTPVAFTTTPPGFRLTNGIPFCEVNGWLGTRRLVALPFSDHCVPLVESTEQLADLLGQLRNGVAARRWRRVQIRATEVAAEHGEGRSVPSLVLHKLDLRPQLDEIFGRFHPSCIQRKIRRAEREGLTCRKGRSEEFLRDFYRLLLATRRRHGLPPQPLQWFRNLIAAFGEKLEMHVAYAKETAVAAMLTLRYKQTLVYKYGCSDKRFSASGGMQLLFWNAIQQASQSGLVEFDLGRTELVNDGLVTFKDRLGAKREPLAYFEFPMRNRAQAGERSAAIRARLCSHAPDAVLAATGKLLYRYMA